MDGPAFTRLGPMAPNAVRLALVVLALAPVLAAAPAVAQVQVQTLAPPDLFSVGTGASDLPSDLWTGSSGALAKAVMPVLGTRPMSFAATALARRVLSASANGPEGVGDDPVLAASRAEALLDLGDAAGVQTITDRTPSLPQKTELSRVAAEADLIEGQDDKACAIGDGLAGGRDGAYWLRLRAYCQARAGQGPAAQLTLDLSEQAESTPDFQRLMNALLAGKDAGAPALDNGLDFALSRRVSAIWTQGMAGAAAPIVVAVARDPAAPQAARVDAVARAARLGLPAPDAVAAALPPPPADIATVNRPGPYGEASLIALASATNDMTIKEAAIIALLDRSKDVSELQALAPIAAPFIGQLIAAKAVLKEPAPFAMAAATAGDLASAKAARAEVGQGGSAPPSPTDLALLDALIAIASPNQDSATAALDAALVQADPTARAKMGQALGLLSALGAPMNAQERFDLSSVDLDAKAPASRLVAMDLAARAGRMGDTALYALQIASDAGPAGMATGDRIRIVQALAQAGLKTDARAFAVEGLLALQGRP